MTITAAPRFDHPMPPEKRFNADLATDLLDFLASPSTNWHQGSWRTVYDLFDPGPLDPGQTRQVSRQPWERCQSSFCAAGWIGQTAPGVEWLAPLASGLRPREIQHSGLESYVTIPWEDPRLSVILTEDPEWKDSAHVEAVRMTEHVQQRAERGRVGAVKVAGHLAEEGITAETHAVMVVSIYAGIALGFHPSVHVPLFGATVTLDQLRKAVDAIITADESLDPRHRGELSRTTISGHWSKAALPCVL